MGYQAEKNLIEEKIKRIKRIVLLFVVVLLASLCVFSAFVPPDTWKYYVNTPNVEKRKDGEMKIHYLDVGQGDCMLIELPDGKVAMIDGGDASSNVKLTILRYLNALQIDTIDYLIVSHADKDHCGALAEVVRQKRILNAYLPTMDIEKACSEYKEFYAEILEEGCSQKLEERYLKIAEKEKDGYDFLFLHPYAKDGSDNDEASDNENSAVLWLDYLGASALFMGDVTKKVESNLIRDDGLDLFQPFGVDLSSVEILKISHHGSEYATDLSFLEYTHTQTAIISCGENNPYSHPSYQVLSNLQKASVTTKRTDKDGTIVVTIHQSGEYSLS